MLIGFYIVFQLIYGYVETIKEEIHACICKNKGSFTVHLEWFLAQNAVGTLNKTCIYPIPLFHYISILFNQNSWNFVWVGMFTMLLL